MEPERVRELVVLQGRVQGVGLRERVLQVARGYDVAGTVRNLRAGDAVEIDVEGEQSGIDAFVADLERAFAEPGPHLIEAVIPSLF